MTHRPVVANELEYDFAPDDDLPITRRTWAVASGQLVDELTEAPIAVTARLRVETLHVAGKVGANGTFSLVAQPGLRFPPAPGPRPNVRVHITADGFLPLTLDFSMAFDQRAILSALAAGANVVTLTSAVGLLPGQTVALGAAAHEELSRIQALGPAANQVTLADALTRAHPAGDVFIPLMPPATVIAMRREPVSLRGRVVRPGPSGAPPIPVANAKVALADY